jgi:hypothetical protein
MPSQRSDLIELLRRNGLLEAMARACLLRSRPFLEVLQRVLDGLDENPNLKTSSNKSVKNYLATRRV